ncbi:GNAT family N-acetyltransferase [Brassicibacter mesophilus]|uniref:GNAT family N-acetyltransferase n=1 Tax=Brassicibacter mesophilus TaxID=745119 RepID=UPI003D1D39C6
MIKKLNLNDTETVKRVLELQIASYKVEADILGFYEIPPLKDTIDSLKKCDEIFYGYHIRDALAGIISYKTINDTLDIHRVAVHPNFFRIGVGGKLVDYVEGNERAINRIIVCTGNMNIPAVSLYLKKGYKKINDIEVSKGIYLTQFEKILNFKAI